MKKIVLIIPILAVVFSSCKTSQVVTYNDDVYASPSEEKRLARIAAAEKLKKEEAEKHQAEQARMAQKAKDDSNPYYKDPSYNQDDYYDYQYASRVRRFGSPMNGAGYYDNYYTNSYMYNQNPSCYGTSIYSSYNYLMPSNQFNSYSNGLSFGLGYGNGYGYNSYNPYGYGCGYNSYNNGYYNGYNNGYNSGMYGYGYNPYGYSGYGYNPYGYNSYGYGNGYNPYYGNSGWGYFNSHDVNSGYSHYGIRGSNGGGNSPRNTTGGMAVPDEYANERARMVQSVQQQQESTPRFTEVARPKSSSFTSGNGTIDNQGAGNNHVRNGGYNSQGIDQGTGSYNNSPSSTTNGTNTNPGSTKSSGGFWPSVFGGNGTGTNVNNSPVNTPDVNTTETPRSHGSSMKTSGMSKENQSYGTSTERDYNPGGGGWNSGGGGSSSPRGGGGGGGGGSSRPR